MSNNRPSPLARLWRKARTPLGSAIRQDVWGAAHQHLYDETRRIVRSMRERRASDPVKPTETFVSLMRRKGYTEEQLHRALTVYLRVHWAMYLLTGAGIVYAAWLALVDGAPLSAASTLLVAVGAAIHGYAYGYRAWQIRNRQLRSLHDAVRDIDTYLVI